MTRRCLGLSLRRWIDDVLDRLLEAAPGAVDHVLVEPCRGALWRGDDQDLTGREYLERILDRLDGVGVAEPALGTNPVAPEAADAGAQAPRRVRACGVFVDVPPSRCRVVSWRDDEYVGRAAAGVAANARAELG